jgi:hypothetical protein
MSSYIDFNLSKDLLSGEGYVERVFEEVNLPFDHLEEDYVEGEELRNSLTSNSVREKMEDYSIFTVQNLDGYDIKMVNRSLSGFFSPGVSGPYISSELVPNDEYSHLRVELGASSEAELEDISSDLEVLEAGLEGYFENREVSAKKEERILAMD